MPTYFIFPSYFFTNSDVSSLNYIQFSPCRRFFLLKVDCDQNSGDATQYTHEQLNSNSTWDAIQKIIDLAWSSFIESFQREKLVESTLQYLIFHFDIKICQIVRRFILGSESHELISRKFLLNIKIQPISIISRKNLYVPCNYTKRSSLMMGVCYRNR